MKVFCRNCRRTVTVYEEPPEWDLCPECYEEHEAYERRQHGNKKPVVKNP